MISGHMKAEVSELFAKLGVRSGSDGGSSNCLLFFISMPVFRLTDLSFVSDTTELYNNSMMIIKNDLNKNLKIIWVKYSSVKSLI